MTQSPSQDLRAYPSRPLLAASAAVFRDSRVLVARRAAAPLAGSWSLPGGLVEPGEPLAAAAAREVLEETGVEAETVATADIVEIIHADEAGGIARHYVIVAFVARWIAGEARPGEATDAVCWLDLDDLNTLDFTEGTADVIRKAATMIEPGGT